MLRTILESKMLETLVYHHSQLYCSCGYIITDQQQLNTHLGSQHKEERVRPWTSLKPRLRLILQEFLAAAGSEDVLETKVAPAPGDGEVEKVCLPPDLFCICVGEPDLGLHAADIPCSRCGQVLPTLDALAQHRSAVHRLGQIISGQNITFERPGAEGGRGRSAYFCPMVECKYHIACSQQAKYFATFKLLKQHYAKVHASRTHVCEQCGSTFGTALYLARHACAAVFVCQSGCGSAYRSEEALRTHCRRTGHPLPSGFTKAEKSKKKCPTSQSLLGLGAQLPSAALHLNAALALSELAFRQVPKADIGLQTDIRIATVRRFPPSSPRDSRSKRTAETQTGGGGTQAAAAAQRGGGGGNDRQPLVSCQVQTLGEFTVRPKKRKLEATNQQGSQCRLSPHKRPRPPPPPPNQHQRTETTQTSHFLALGLSVDIDPPEDWDLLPLVRNTNSTQTSPRVPPIYRKLSRESVDSLPSLEEIEAISLDGAVGSLGEPASDQLSFPTAHSQLEEETTSIHQTPSISTTPKLGEIRQFSTETQTELDAFSISWEAQEGRCLGGEGDELELPGAENLLSNMETQTQDDLLLCINSCTQTGGGELLSCLADFPDLLPSLLTCTTETQTSLTSLAQQQHLPRDGAGIKTADVQLMTDFT